MALSLDKLVEFLGISPEEAVAAIVSHFTPIQASVLVNNWREDPQYGNSAPRADEVDATFQANGYKCCVCGRRSRQTLDHKDGNPANHTLNNLRVVCVPCKRARGVADPDMNHQFRILTAAIELWERDGVFPLRQQIIARAGVKQIGGVTYQLRWLQHVLQAIGTNQALQQTGAACSLSGICSSPSSPGC